MHTRRTEVGRPPRVGDLVRKLFEAAGADHRQLAPVIVLRRFFVEIDRNLELRRDVGREFLRDRDALFHRRSFERNERHDIDRTDARMLAMMNAQIDARNRRIEQSHRSLTNRIRRFGDIREHRPIVIRIRMNIQQMNAGSRAHRLRDRIDRRLLAAFGNVGDAFDHAVKVMSNE